MRASRAARGVLALLLLALAGCSVSVPTPGPSPTAVVRPPNPYAPLAVLRQDPAAGLRLPGADGLDTGAGEGETAAGLRGYRPAEIVHWSGTQASVPEVFAYYDRELRAAGYALIPYGAAQSSTESAVWGWCKPQAAFRLGIVIQAKFDLGRSLQGRTYQTIMRTILTGRDGSPCPPTELPATPTPRP